MTTTAHVVTLCESNNCATNWPKREDELLYVDYNHVCPQLHKSSLTYQQIIKSESIIAPQL